MSTKDDKRLVCGKCGDGTWKSYKQARHYFNPKCNQCQKRSDCYICSSCNTAFCEKCGTKNKEEINLLSQKLKQKNLDITTVIITQLMEYPYLNKNDNFKDIIKTLITFDNSESIAFYHQSLDANMNNITSQRSAYIEYIKSNLFDFIRKLRIQPSILKECLNYLDSARIIFGGKVIHELIDEYFLKNDSYDDEKEGEEIESDRLLKCIVLCIDHYPTIINQCNNNYSIKPILYIFLNYFKYETELKHFMESLSNIINIQKQIDLFQLLSIYFNKNTAQKEKLLIVQCLPLVFRLYPQLLLSKRNNQNLLSFSLSLKNNHGDDDEVDSDLIQLLSDKDSLQQYAETMYVENPEYKQRESIDWIYPKKEEKEENEDEDDEVKEGVFTNPNKVKVNMDYVAITDDDDDNDAVNNDVGNKNIDNKCCNNISIIYLLKYLIIYLAICCVQIGSAVLQFILLYVNNNTAQCTLNESVNSAEYEVEVISLFVLTLLPLIFFALFVKSEERTIEYVLFLVLFIINWFVMFGLSIHSYVTWNDNVECTNNSWHTAMKMLFMIWFIQQALVTFIFFCYVMNKLLNGLDTNWKKKFGIFLVAASVQITACIMQIILIFNDNKCRMNDNIHITAYKVESISLLILTVFAGLVIASKLKKLFRFILFGIIWCIIFGLSIHSYSIWDNYMSCNDNSYRIGMIILFIIWFSEQILIMILGLIYLIGELVKEQDITFILVAIFVFSCFVLLPFISSLLQIVYIADNTCDATGGSLSAAISLFIITIILFLITICELYQLDGNPNNLTESAEAIGLSICWGLLWFIQFGLVNTSFYNLADNEINCDSNNTVKHALYGLFLSWLIIYSIIFIVAIIAGIVISCIEIGPKYVCAAFIILCQIAIYVVAPILQIILITSDDCEGDLVSISETIFLIIFIILQCYLMIIISFEEKTKYVVACCEFILFVVIYIFVINSMNTWGSGQVQCGSKQGMKIAAFILFLIWMIEYTLYIIMACCIAIIQWTEK